jgi:hypothetical protein
MCAERRRVVMEIKGCRFVQKKQTINCDQVAWLLDIFGRYLPKDGLPAVSQKREMMKYGMLYEVMEIANLEFEDVRAQWNGTPNTARYNATTREK